MLVRVNNNIEITVLEIKGEHGREAEDALPFELDFLAYLTRHAIEAFGKDDIDEYTDTDKDGDPDGPFASGQNRYGVRVIGSPACGAMHWHSVAPEVLQCERAVAARYWHHRLP